LGAFRVQADLRKDHKSITAHLQSPNLHLWRSASREL